MGQHGELTDQQRKEAHDVARAYLEAIDRDEDPPHFERDDDGATPLLVFYAGEEQRRTGVPLWTVMVALVDLLDEIALRTVEDRADGASL